MESAAVKSWLEENFTGNWRYTFDNKGFVLLVDTLTESDIEMLNEFDAGIQLNDTGHFVLRANDELSHVS